MFSLPPTLPSVLLYSLLKARFIVTNGNLEGTITLVKPTNAFFLWWYIDGSGLNNLEDKKD